MTVTTTHRRSRRLRVAALTLAATCSLSACQITSPITTDLDYDPADGVSVETELIEVLDLMVISPGQGEPGILTGYVVNSGEEPITVNFALEHDGERQDLSPKIEVAPGDAARADGRSADDEDFSDPVRIDTVEARVGSLVTVRVTTSTDGLVSKRVPVLPPDGVYSVYRDALSASE
ncbi:MAG: hypothetical protein WBG57_07470 [Ornithinimicrobium sp.]